MVLHLQQLFGIIFRFLDISQIFQLNHHISTDVGEVGTERPQDIIFLSIIFEVYPSLFPNLTKVSIPFFPLNYSKHVIKVIYINLCYMGLIAEWVDLVGEREPDAVYVMLLYHQCQKSLMILGI